MVKANTVNKSIFIGCREGSVRAKDLKTNNMQYIMIKDLRRIKTSIKKKLNLLDKNFYYWYNNN